MWLLPPAYEVRGKVMFSVCLSTREEGRKGREGRYPGQDLGVVPLTSLSHYPLFLGSRPDWGILPPLHSLPLPAAGYPPSLSLSLLPTPPSSWLQGKTGCRLTQSDKKSFLHSYVNVKLVCNADQCIVVLFCFLKNVLHFGVTVLF